MRPRSIVLFESLSLAAVALGALTLALSWDEFMANVSTRIRGAGIEPALIILSLLYVGLLVLLILLTSRRGNAVAKWLFVAIILLGLLGTVPGIGGLLRGGVRGWATIAQLLLQLAALWFLFVPASRLWFRDWRGRTPRVA
jgi:hypothetical protein